MLATESRVAKLAARHVVAGKDMVADQNPVVGHGLVAGRHLVVD